MTSEHVIPSKVVKTTVPGYLARTYTNKKTPPTAPFKTLGHKAMHET